MPGGSKSGGGLKVTPYKMKRFSGFGNLKTKISQGLKESASEAAQGSSKVMGDHVALAKGGKKLAGSLKVAKTAKRSLSRKLKMKPPYKKPVGPRATPKTSKKQVAGDVDLSPGFEDPIKIQKLQRKGLTPSYQTFVNKRK